MNPQPARNVVAEYVHAGPWTTYVQPFCGRFGLTEVIAKTTEKPEQIWTSDICVFSALVGTWLSGRDLADVGFEILHPEIQALARYFDGDVQQVAACLQAVKFAQLKSHKPYYYQAAAKEIARNPKRYVDYLSAELTRLKNVLEGIHFRVLDYKDEIREHMNNPDALIICDPPCYAQGYTRMFEQEGVYRWKQPEIPEFMPAEFESLLQLCGDAAATVLCMKYPTHTFKLPGWLTVASCSLTHARLNRVWQFVANRPLQPFAVRDYEKPLPVKYPVFVNGPVDRNSKVFLVKVTDPEATYYRDLMVHRLADSGGEEQFVLLIDGQVAAVIGILTNFFTRRGQDYVFLNYAIEVYNRQEPRLHKLVTALVYSRQFKEQLIAQARGLANTLQFRDFNKMRSTKLSPTMQLWNMPRDTRILVTEKLKTGMWRILYEYPFSTKTFHQCVVEYVERKHKCTTESGLVAQRG